MPIEGNRKWGQNSAFATEAELLDPTEKEVRNPAIVKAFRRIGLSDQAGTGIRAIFRNWHELGRVPPQLKNDKARKEFELVLINKPLVTDAMKRYRITLGIHLTPVQADVLALALSLPEGEPLSLTAIRSLGISTSQLQKYRLTDAGQRHFTISPRPVSRTGAAGVLHEASGKHLGGPGYTDSHASRVSA